MKNFQKKSRLKVFFESSIILLLLFILILFFIWNIIGFIGKMRDTINNRRIAEHKLLELVRSKENLSREIGKLKTDEGVEESIRDKFGLAREGEQMIVIVDDKSTKNIENTPENKGSFSFFTDLFK